MHKKIVKWLEEYLKQSGTNGFVIGVSGGVDSALTSTLCALTKKSVVVVGMPINQETGQLSRSQRHMDWLCTNFSNVKQVTKNLTPLFEIFKNISRCESSISLVNSASRLRMVMLYAIANEKNMLVAGTGNKVEDYGIGFFTKFGDGGVDISPIADLLKSEVRRMAAELGVLEEIVNAVPTDGLWDDNRSDEEQIGATYDELEWALKHYDEYGDKTEGLSGRQSQVLSLYVKRHLSNKHKLETPPVCFIGESI